MNKIWLVALLLVGACSSDLFITHNGNMPSNERIAQVTKGQSQEEVLDLLGSPSSVVSLDKNTWIYMSADIKQVAFFKPEEISRDVLTIKFDKDENVAEVERITKANGKEIKISEDATETLGHKPGFFQRFFGGVGQYSPFGGASPDGRM